MKTRHWGLWINARAKHVGFATQADLAEAVGIAPENLSRLLRHAERPRMRATTREALAKVLRVAPIVLLRDWRAYAPEDCPDPGVSATLEGMQRSIMSTDPHDERLRHEIQRFLAVITGDRLRALYSYILDQVEAEIHSRSATEKRQRRKIG